MHKSKYTVYRGGSLEDDKIVIPSESSITSYIPTDYKDLSDMELMSRLITSGGDEEELVKLGQESTRRARSKEYDKYIDKLEKIYITKWESLGLTKKTISSKLKDYKNTIDTIINGPDELSIGQKKLNAEYKIINKDMEKFILALGINTYKNNYRSSWKSKFKITDKDVDSLVSDFFDEEKPTQLLEDFNNDKINIFEVLKKIDFSLYELNDRLNKEHEQTMKDKGKKSTKKIKEKENLEENELNAYIETCKEGYGQMWAKTVGLGERDIKELFTPLTTSGGKINNVLKQFDNNEINFSDAKKLIGGLFNTLHESVIEKDNERKNDIKKEVVHMKEKIKESNAIKEEIPTITTSKKKKSKAKAKATATAEEVAELEEAYKRTEELSKQQEKEGNIRLKELRSLDEEKEVEEVEEQKKYEGSQHIKTFDKLFTEIIKYIKTSGGKGHLFEDIMTKTNIPSEVPLSARENKELNQSIRHILTEATGITQKDIPVLSSKFLPPNCSNYSDGLPYDLLDQYKNFIELKYYNTYMFGYKVKNGILYETASGVNIQVNSVQFQMSKFLRDNVDDFKIFYTREGSNNFKIHNVYIKKDNNNKTINKPINPEYDKNLTVIMAFEKSFYYFNPLELLTDDIMDLVSTSDAKAYKITSTTYIPNLSKLNFFINESLISIGDQDLAKNDTRIPFSYFKRI